MLCECQSSNALRFLPLWELTNRVRERVTRTSHKGLKSSILLCRGGHFAPQETQTIMYRPCHTCYTFSPVSLSITMAAIVGKSSRGVHSHDVAPHFAAQSLILSRAYEGYIYLSMIHSGFSNLDTTHRVVWIVEISYRAPQRSIDGFSSRAGFCTSRVSTSRNGGSLRPGP